MLEFLIYDMYKMKQKPIIFFIDLDATLIGETETILKLEKLNFFIAQNQTQTTYINKVSEFYGFFS